MQYATGESPASVPENATISSGPFFPVVETVEFYTDYTIPASLAPGIVKTCLRMAIIRVNNSLTSYKSRLLIDGYSKLEDYPADPVDGIHPKKLLYLRAVYCDAKANILKETQTADRKEAAENMAKTSEQTEDKYREWAQAAIRDLCGRNQIGVVTI